MNAFHNEDGMVILLAVAKAIQENKAYLSEVDGLIGDGDHGMNMNKGFKTFQNRFEQQQISFTTGLNELGTILLTEIGGSMGPIYGTILMDMAGAGDNLDEIDLTAFAHMLTAGLEGLSAIVEAKKGDKTLVDTLDPAVEALNQSVAEHISFQHALEKMKKAAVRGKESTRELVAKFGRSSRLGERSRGVLDAGATSCCILLTTMADAILKLLVKEDVKC